MTEDVSGWYTEGMSDLLTPPEVAERLRVSKETLARWRKEGVGPKPYFLSPQSIRYKPEDVDAWLASQQQGPTED